LFEHMIESVRGILLQVAPHISASGSHQRNR